MNPPHIRLAEIRVPHRFITYMFAQNIFGQEEVDRGVASGRFYWAKDYSALICNDDRDIYFRWLCTGVGT